jgi:hypothetical protein
MSTYAEMVRERKKARAFYVALRTLDLNRRAVEGPAEPSGHHIEVRGLRYLSDAHDGRVRRRIGGLRPGLIRSLMLGTWERTLL